MIIDKRAIQYAITRPKRHKIISKIYNPKVNTYYLDGKFKKKVRASKLKKGDIVKDCTEKYQKVLNTPSKGRLWEVQVESFTEEIVIRGLIHVAYLI